MIKNDRELVALLAAICGGMRVQAHMADYEGSAKKEARLAVKAAVLILDAVEFSDDKVA